MATWYRNNNRSTKKEGAKKPLASTEAKAAPSRLQPSWTQLRFCMELAEELHIAWTECIGTYEFADEEECGNAAAPVHATIEFKQRPSASVAPIGGTRIDAQFIAINRTVQLAAPAPARKPEHNDIPMRHLQQLSVSSQWRLNAALA